MNEFGTRAGHGAQGELATARVSAHETARARIFRIETDWFPIDSNRQLAKPRSQVRAHLGVMMSALLAMPRTDEPLMNEPCPELARFHSVATGPGGGAQ